MKDIQLSVEVEADDLTCRMYSKSLILVDGPRFSRVIANMVSNALKFTPEGGRVTITSTVIDTGLTEVNIKLYRLRIAVHDTGAGISKVHKCCLLCYYCTYYFIHCYIHANCVVCYRRRIKNCCSRMWFSSMQRNYRREGDRDSGYGVSTFCICAHDTTYGYFDAVCYTQF